MKNRDHNNKRLKSILEKVKNKNSELTLDDIDFLLLNLGNVDDDIIEKYIGKKERKNKIDLTTCPKCGEKELKTIHEVQEGDELRGVLQCQNCEHRITVVFDDGIPDLG